jgi:hypothetical protein
MLFGISLFVLGIVAGWKVRGGGKHTGPATSYKFTFGGVEATERLLLMAKLTVPAGTSEVPFAIDPTSGKDVYGNVVTLPTDAPLAWSFGNLVVGDVVLDAGTTLSGKVALTHTAGDGQLVGTGDLDPSKPGSLVITGDLTVTADEAVTAEVVWGTPV